MPTYLVERYLPGHDRAWLETALARLARGRHGVRYLGSTYVPTDESCFCRFEAETVDDVRDANAVAGVPFARIVAAEEIGNRAAGSDQGRRPIMKHSLIGVVAIAAAALVVTASAAGHSAARSGALHVTKECSEYHGKVGEFCTITSSNITAIKRGMRVVYLQAPGDDGVLDSDIVLSSGHGPRAFGHVVLNLAKAQGVVTLSGGTGRFANFQADVVVTLDSSGVWHWDGSYSFAGSDDD